MVARHEKRRRWNKCRKYWIIKYFVGGEEYSKSSPTAHTVERQGDIVLIKYKVVAHKNTLQKRIESIEVILVAEDQREFGNSAFSVSHQLKIIELAINIVAMSREACGSGLSEINELIDQQYSHMIRKLLHEVG